MQPSDPEDPPADEDDQALQDWEEEVEESPPPPTDRELLLRLVDLVEEQKKDLATIRWRTGCLYAWLILALVFAVLAALFGSGR
jgi:hypothetical protein